MDSLSLLPLNFSLFRDSTKDQVFGLALLICRFFLSHLPFPMIIEQSCCRLALRFLCCTFVVIFRLLTQGLSQTRRYWDTVDGFSVPYVLLRWLPFSPPLLNTNISATCYSLSLRQLLCVQTGHVNYHIWERKSERAGLIGRVGDT